jgi:hypothetical protein
VSLLSEIIIPETKPMVVMMVAVGADDPEETMVPEEAMVPEAFVAKISESPDKDSETTINRGHADVRLTVGGLGAVGQGSTCGKEEPKQERKAREGSD